ncbi:hypothetical protein MRB53_014206 [Persea americana]|uniref:Uncharacterized protein n=1 Tax=Persea americana TaxID=3435 RepID=A0ACC2KA99_PERAE|nr:hypothetical protein MRB53_014206 [Persea americana]
MPLQAVSCKHLCSLQFSSLDSPIARRPSISTASCKHRPLSTKSRPDQTRPDQSRLLFHILLQLKSLADSPGLGGSLSPAIANLTALAQLVVHPGRIFAPSLLKLGQILPKYVLRVSLSRSCQQCSERQETQFKPISFRSEIAADKTRWCICRPSDEKWKNSGENEMGFVDRTLGFRT